jgi:hypothetical protein
LSGLPPWSDGCTGGLPPSVLSQLVVRPDTCYAQGEVDSSTGESIAFVPGPETSEAVQIENVVSLSDAWHKGARDWDEQGRPDFANDPHNLLAVGAKANSDKAFRDANAWLPPNVTFRCESNSPHGGLRWEPPTGSGFRRTRIARWQRRWTAASRGRPGRRWV